MVGLLLLLTGRHRALYRNITQNLSLFPMNSGLSSNKKGCSNTRQKGRSTVKLSQATGMSVSTQKNTGISCSSSRRLSHAFYTAHAQVRTQARRNVYKMASFKPETVLRLVDSLSDSYGEYVYSKGDRK